MELRIDKVNKRCPKCGSRFGVAWIKDKDKVICFHATCEWFTTLAEWNRTNPDNKFEL